MKCKRLNFRTFGTPSDVLEIEEFTPETLESGEVLLEILASPINPADLNFIEGTYGIKPQLPCIPGIECSAEVIQSNSPNFSPGDLVMPVSRIGGWATHAVTRDSNLIRLPKTIDPIQAAMLRINPGTALLLLTAFEKLSEGDLVALNASNSGVGQCVIQLAKTMGIRTLCFLRKAEIASTLKHLGATHVFPDTSEGLIQAIEILKDETAKLAFNAVGGESSLRIMKFLTEGGTHITYGAMSHKPLTIPNSPLIFQDLRIRGLWVTKWIEHTPLSELQIQYSKLADLCITNQLSQSVDSTFKLDDFQQAFARNKSPDKNGKIIFSIA